MQFELGGVFVGFVLQMFVVGACRNLAGECICTKVNEGEGKMLVWLVYDIRGCLSPIQVLLIELAGDWAGRLAIVGLDFIVQLRLDLWLRDMGRQIWSKSKSSQEYKFLELGIIVHRKMKR